jgi:hypothetical protein
MKLDWRWVTISTFPRTRMLDITISLRRGWLALRWFRNVPYDDPRGIVWARSSRYTQVFIVHPPPPLGGGTFRLRCVECGADYPMTQTPTPCAFCAVMKESGTTLRLGSWSRERRWSDHGYAVAIGYGKYVTLRIASAMEGGIPETFAGPGPEDLPKRYRSYQEARAASERYKRWRTQHEGETAAAISEALANRMITVCSVVPYPTPSRQ